MSINISLAEFFLKVTILVICTISLISKTGLMEGKFQGNIFLFFTNLSILLCAIFYCGDIYSCIALGGENTLLLNLKGAILQYTFITMLIYNFVLVPKHKNTEIKHEFYSLQDVSIHCIVPGLVLLEWFITRKKAIYMGAPIIWLLVPLLYFVMVSIKGKLKLGSKFDYADSYYPYFFIDVSKIGLKKVTINFFVMLFFFLGIGYLIFVLDHWVF